MNQYSCTVINGKHTVRFFVEDESIKRAYQAATTEAKKVFPTADENVISITVEEVAILLGSRKNKSHGKE